MTFASVWIITAFATLITWTTAVSTDWPSLEFHFTLKRNTMKIHGQLNFSMYANPILSTGSVLYDVWSTFTEDEIVYNYSLVNGVGFISSALNDSTVDPSVICLDNELGDLPPINALIRSLNDAVAIPNHTGGVIQCSRGNLFKTEINGFEFAVCALGSSCFTMQNSDVDVEVRYLDNPVTMYKSIRDLTPNCTAKATANFVTPLAKSLLTGNSILARERHLKAEFDFSFKGFSSCTCKSAVRPCVFIHGMGVSEEFPENQDNFTEYWGDHLEDHSPCCSSLQFAHLDTVNNTWTSAKQQQKVCDRILAVSNTSTDSTVSDTIIVTHSMGNLMFAGAIANGRCDLDSSSTWVGLAAPMKGSMASDFVQESCAGETNVVWERIGNITGRCPPSKALRSLAYQGGNHTTERLDAAYTAAQEVYQENVHAVMCSKWYSGIVSKYQVQFWAMGTMVPHKSRKNDGMVEFQSCAVGLPEEEFGDSWESKFYRTRMNHYDMEFLSGDALLNGEKMPVKWFECLL
ncbi:hypothetical protein P3T76_015406 [Phytophthora citrophthora]|uniref:GPI inositol-deacylase n=1 Tax=Phytophthora citrophthora TaxID=4793 RepID=A0AAD9G009_9STRA|nr:hypothetical protein P3T76_015406 [Phytophthora citrophthora]